MSTGQGGVRSSRLWPFVLGVVPIVALLGAVQLAGAGGSFKLPDSGQRKCYQGVSPWAEIRCKGTGQDGAYVIAPLSYTDNGDGTVTDDHTGVIWQQGQSDNPMSWDEAEAYCGSLTLGAASDWRLPSRRELVSIIDYGILYPGPTIDSTYFPNTPAVAFWTSTIDPADTRRVWSAFFDFGGVAGIDRDHPMAPPTHVRCARGGQPSPSPRFTVEGDGTVTDNWTRLQWQQDTGDTGDWSSVIAYCEDLSLAGFDDWRLPNIKELDSLVDDTEGNPTIDGGVWPSSPDGTIGGWASTTLAHKPEEAFNIRFPTPEATPVSEAPVAWTSNGRISNDPKSAVDVLWARCVRGGHGQKHRP